MKIRTKSRLRKGKTVCSTENQTGQMAGKYDLRIFCLISICLDKYKEKMVQETHIKNSNRLPKDIKTAPVVWKHKILDIASLRHWSLRRACKITLPIGQYCGSGSIVIRIHLAVLDPYWEMRIRTREHENWPKFTNKLGFLLFKKAFEPS